MKCHPCAPRRVPSVALACCSRPAPPWKESAAEIGVNYAQECTKPDQSFLNRLCKRTANAGLN